MFDFGFQELLLIFVVALVVLGPKRMQQLAGTIGRWVGKARGMARQFREQLESEVNLEDLEKSSKPSPFTPAPTAGLDGSPAPAEPAAAAPQPTDSYGGTYPYAAPIEPFPADKPEPAAPQPGDDTYSHAHGTGTDPMPYLPPEAEGFAAAPPPVPLDEPLNPDHGQEFSPAPATPADAPASKDPAS